jgi:hypothetical protein
LLTPPVLDCRAVADWMRDADEALMRDDEEVLVGMLG